MGESSTAPPPSIRPIRQGSRPLHPTRSTAAAARRPHPPAAVQHCSAADTGPFARAGVVNKAIALDLSLFIAVGVLVRAPSTRGVFKQYTLIRSKRVNLKAQARVMFQGVPPPPRIYTPRYW